jgi:zinc protease
MRAILLLTALALALPALASEAEVHRLDNGLTVITREMHYAPVAVSAIAYRVGARNEPDSILGMSHFCEHLMFKGTPSMPKSRFWQIIQRDGGWANAFTGQDLTVYFMMLPAQRLEDALRIESDRMTGCTIDSAEVISERGVVHEERRMRTTDSPSGALYEAMRREAFRVHPYGNPVIGYDENILDYDHCCARDYYESYYCPSNAVLSLVGDFETDSVLAMVEEYFAPLPAREPGPEPEETEPPQTDRRRVDISHPSNLPRALLAFHTPEGDHPATPALMMLSTYLSAGRSSWLEQNLVDAGLASSAYAYNEGGIDPGLFVVGLTLPPEGDVEAAVDSVEAELRALASEPLPEEELRMLRRRTKAAEILADASPVRLALGMAMDMAAFGDHLLTGRIVDAMDTVTAGDVEAVAAEYLDPGRATLAVLTPEGGRGGGAGGATGLPTDVTEPQAISYEGLEIPENMLRAPNRSISAGIDSLVLENGMRVYVLEDHTFPVAAIRFSVPMGDYREDPAMAGLSGVAAETMMRGTAELGYGEFHRRLERLGASLRFSSGRSSASGSVTLLSADLEVGLQSVADLLLRPALRREDLQRVLEETGTSVESRAENVFGVAGDNIDRLLSRSPELAHVTTRQTLDRIGHREVFAFYQLCCRPEGAVLTVVGDVDAGRVMETARDLFAGWDNPKSTLPAASFPPFPDAEGDTLVETMPGRMQAGIMVGAPGPGYLNDSYVAFGVMNRILGAGIGSRLGHSVRDEQGLAYVVGSNLTPMKRAGRFAAYLSTRADYATQALSSVLAEFDRISTEQVEDVELRLAQSCEVGRHAVSSAGYGSIAGYVTSTAERGLPLDHDIRRLRSVVELTPEDILDVASEYLDREGWFVSIAGGITADLAPLPPSVE